MVPGYSRLMWLSYYERQTMPVVMEELKAAFLYFDGEANVRIHGTLNRSSAPGRPDFRP